MLSIILTATVLVVVNGQSCLIANNSNGLPPFMDYRQPRQRPDTIPEQHQVIISSYRFTCCGNVTEWGVDVHPAGRSHDMVYTLNLQVWRPSPTVDITGCYNLVGNNVFTSVPLTSQVARVTPLPQDRIEFQPGDVLGFILENTIGNDGGVVLLTNSVEQGINGYETEEVWHAKFSSLLFSNRECQLAVGSQPGRALNTMISAAPVITVSYNTTMCPTPSQLPPPPTQNTASQSTGLIAGITIMAIVIILLTLVLVVVVSMKLKRNGGSRPQDTTVHAAYYDYPAMETQTRNLTDMDINNANVAEANLNEAYAMNLIMERNVAYGTRYQSRHGANEKSNIQD